MREKNYVIFGGVKVPRLTYILQKMGLVNTAWYTEKSANRGTDIHILTTVIDSGIMYREDIIEGEYGGYLGAYFDFLNDNEVRVIESEKEVLYKMLYVGHLDRVIELNGEKWIVDIKTGGFERWHGLQLAGYGLAYNEKYSRAILQLKKDGKYTFKTSFKSESFNSNIWIDELLSIIHEYHNKYGGREL